MKEKQDSDSNYSDKMLALAQMKLEVPFLKEMIENLILQHAPIARCYKSFFDNLMQQGFTESQALDILKSKKYYDL